MGNEPNRKNVSKNALDLMASLLESLPSATIVTDPARKIILINQQFCDLFGIEEKPDSLTGTETVALLSGYADKLIDPEGINRRVQEILEQRPASSSDEMRLKDGRIIIRNYRPLYMAGEFMGHLWSCTDETERIRAHELLTEQKAFYEEILDNLPADIGVFSPEYRYLYVNPHGIRDRELRSWIIGRTDHDYCEFRGKDKSMADYRREIFERVRDTKQEVTYEEEIPDRDGRSAWHVRRIRPVLNPDGSLKLVIGYGLNITDRKEIEQRIRLSEKKYRDIFNQGLALICTHDLDGILLEVNPALCELTGYSEQEMTGRNIRDFVPEKDRADFDRIYLKGIREQARIKGLFRVITRDGSHVYLLYRNHKVDFEDGNPYVIGFSQDVTERIYMEKQLLEAKEATEQSAKAKQQFLANMSHEVRTPMNGIIGITSLLMDLGPTEEQLMYLRLISDSSNNLLNIINDILDLEKINAGHLHLEQIDFDVVHKLKSAWQLFRLEAEKNGVALELHNRLGEKFAVNGDPTKFTQVINNLLSNAIKFTKKGSISLLAEVHSETAEGITLHLAVKDTGIGIEPGKLVRIFDPFAQAESDTARKYGGTGLGLSITKSLVEAQQGKLWVESKVGEGSTFNVHILYKRVSSENMATAFKPEVNKLGKLRVLLAEDNEINQLLSRKIFQYWDFDLTIASDGNEAVQKVIEQDFDIILMDIQMPEKSGIEACMEIRALPDPHKSQIPVIALTANAMTGEEKKYFAAGMNGFLIKPFREKELYDAIEKVLYPDGHPDMPANPEV